MSAAASISQLESPTTEQADPLSKEEENRERVALEKSTGISPLSPHQPIIAIDLDDVLSQTNEIVAEWHNGRYGSKMDTSLFYYYYYWKNPFWGTPKETFEKVKAFYSTDMIFRAKPVPSAHEGVAFLRAIGYKLVIVTARTQDNKDQSWKWVNKHFPGLFDSIICTGQFKDAHKTGHEVATKLSKAQVCADLGAKLLVDDSLENALQCASSSSPTPVLLFGDYEWNQRLSGPGDATDEMSFDRRLAASDGREFWREETVVIPESTPLYRVKNWREVVEWIVQYRDYTYTNY